MTKRSALRIGVVALVGAAISGACGGTAPPESARAPAKPMLGASKALPEATGPGTSCERVSPGVGPTREAAVRQGASIALARDEGKLVAYVARRDAKTLDLVDATSSKTLARVPLKGEPEQVLVLADGRVLVSLANAGYVDVFEPTGAAERPLDHRCRLAVPAGAFGLAASPDDATVVATSGFDAALTVFDGTTLNPTKAFSLSRSPRGVLVDDKGRAFVSHVAGAELSVVDLAAEGERPSQRKINLSVRAGSQSAQTADLSLARTGSQAYALVSVEVTSPAAASSGAPQSGSSTEGGPKINGAAPPPPPKAQKSKRIVVPMVSIDPGERARPTQFYYGPPPVAGVPKQAPVAVVVDPTSEKSLVTHVLAPTATLRREECLLPRAAAFRSSTERLYIACMGIDAVFEVDARASDPMRAVIRRFDVPQGPTGVAVAEKEGLVLVNAQEFGQIARISLADGSVQFSNLDQDGGYPNTDAHFGRQLFYRTDDPRMTHDGLACASCHPDGLEDGVTWSTPEGPRQTLMLAGRLTGSAPYGWTRGKETLDAYIEDTTRRLGGGSLPLDELQALAVYIKQIPRPPISEVKVSLAEEGKRHFEEQGCGTCHTNMTDRSNVKPQNVGSKADGDWVTDFDTPTLIGVGLSGPYYHDGRYRTLDELLADPKSKMGKTSELKADQRTAIKAYLESL